MKKHIVFIGLFVICTLFIITSSVSEKQNTDSPAVTQTLEAKYTLADYNGRLAIFENGNENPIEVFEIQTSSLPEGDKKMLKTGIQASSYEELLRLTEDYTS